MSKRLIVKGDICTSETPQILKTVKDGYVVSEDGIIKGIFAELPPEYREGEYYDYTGKLILPGLIDLHIHAPQFAFRGTNMDLELIDWLNNYTFPEESKYRSSTYADKAYSMFARAMKESATTRAVIFATSCREATNILMEKMEETGLVSYVGKINMDRNAVPQLKDSGALDSAFNTFGWINESKDRYERTFPILTPRFIPSCSDALMNELREITLTYPEIPLQSHLSENPGECAWVKELCPESKFYGDAYDRFGLFGGPVKTVMAHCVYSSPEEIDLMEDRGVFIAHCPTSNLCLSSGIAPIRKYLERKMRVGLGTDVAGGHSESMMVAITDCIKASKMYWRYVDQESPALSFAEALYLATAGGGEFFGKVGKLEEGYVFDAIVLDDSKVLSPLELSISERAERAAYLNLDLTGLRAKFVQGVKV